MRHLANRVLRGLLGEADLTDRELAEHIALMELASFDQFVADVTDNRAPKSCGLKTDEILALPVAELVEEWRQTNAEPIAALLVACDMVRRGSRRLTAEDLSDFVSALTEMERSCVDHLRNS